VRFLLDTNAISDLIRDPYGRIAARIERHGIDRIGASIISAMELRYGAVQRGSAKLLTAVETVLARMIVQPFAAPADQTYAELRTDLERRGKIIDYEDMLIAAHALTLGVTLVTANVKHFAHVEGLRVEDWSRPKGKA
jgi:tRNA(fMet)-specific endonuclease VapC